MIRPAFSYNDFTAPLQWRALPQGEWLRGRVELSLQPYWPRLRGHHMALLGDLSGQLSIERCGIPFQHYLSPTSGQIHAHLDALPLQNQSMDAVVLCYGLEFDSDPHQLLREADRVLCDGGHLIITGFDPLSALSLGYLWPPNWRVYPWSGRLFTAFRVLDWLSVLGYQTVGHDAICHHSFLYDPQKIAASKFYLPQGPRWLGSSYLIVARKLALPLTPVRERWRMKLMGRTVGAEPVV